MSHSHTGRDSVVLAVALTLFYCPRVSMRLGKTFLRPLGSWCRWVHQNHASEGKPSVIPPTDLQWRFYQASRKRLRFLALDSASIFEKDRDFHQRQGRRISLTSEPNGTRTLSKRSKEIKDKDPLGEKETKRLLPIIISRLPSP